MLTLEALFRAEGALYFDEHMLHLKGKAKAFSSNEDTCLSCTARCGIETVDSA